MRYDATENSVTPILLQLRLCPGDNLSSHLSLRITCMRSAKGSEQICGQESRPLLGYRWHVTAYDVLLTSLVSDRSSDGRELVIRKLSARFTSLVSGP